MKAVFVARILISGVLFFIFQPNAVLVANPLILGTLFSTEVNAVFVAKLLTSGILFSISVIVVLKSVFLTRLLVSGIFFSTALMQFFLLNY